MIPPSWRGRTVDEYHAHLDRQANRLADDIERRERKRLEADDMVLGYDVPDYDLHRARIESLAARLTGRRYSARGGAKAYEDCSLRTLEQLAGQGTDSFPRLLAGAAESVALDRFRRAAPAFRALTRPVSFRDFKASTVARQPDLRLGDLGEAGELTAGVIDDSGETAIKATKAALFRLTRRSVINDDTGSLANIASGAADAALDARESAFFSMLLGNAGAGPTLRDGVAYFHSSRGNLLTGAALNATSVAASLAALRGMRSDSGTPLSLAGRHLLVSPADEAAARVVARDLAVPDSPPPSVIASGHLTSGFYVFADPIERAGFVLGDVFGDPFIFESALDFHSDSIKFRVLTDFGLAPVDPRGVVRVPAA